MNSHSNQAILVAVEDPVLHPEALHVAAATGRPVVESTDPADITRHRNRVSAVLIDAATARELLAVGSHTPDPGGPQRGRIFLLGADPGPSDWKLAMQIHAEEACLLPAQTGELLAALGRRDTPVSARNSGTGTTIGVLGAVGGAGASTLAAALATTLARRGDRGAALLDAVPCSGGIDLLLGIEESRGARWPDLGFRRGSVQAADVLAALPTTVEGLSVLSTARSNVADTFALDGAELNSALACLRAADPPLDVVVDLHPGELLDAALDHLDHLVLLVPAEVRAVAAAVARRLDPRLHQLPVSVVLRHRGWSGLDATEVEEILGVGVTAELGSVARLAKTVELRGLTGLPPRPLGTVAEAVLADLPDAAAPLPAAVVRREGRG